MMKCFDSACVFILNVLIFMSLVKKCTQKINVYIYLVYVCIILDSNNKEDNSSPCFHENILAQINPSIRSNDSSKQTLVFWHGSNCYYNCTSS